MKAEKADQAKKATEVLEEEMGWRQWTL